jgi:hypothetical protein
MKIPNSRKQDIGAGGCPLGPSVWPPYPESRAMACGIDHGPGIHRLLWNGIESCGDAYPTCAEIGVISSTGR